jgi:hypothetical protein
MASVTASWRFVDTRPQPGATIIALKLAKSVRHLGLRPQWHTEQEHLSQAPLMIGQAGGHCRCPWLPLFDGARPMDGQWQWQTQALVRQHEIVIHMEQSQLLTQARLVFAQRVDSPPDGRDMLAKVQIQALDKRRRVSTK